MRHQDLKQFNVPASRFILSKSSIPAFFGGVGNQKTFAGCERVLRYCAENKDARVVVSRKIARALRATTQRELVDLAESLKWVKRYNEHEGVLKLRNGAEIQFWPFEESVQKGIQKIEGMNASMCWLDQAEEFAEEYYWALIRRSRNADSDIILQFTGNPAGHDWIWKLGKAPATKDPDWELFEGTTYDNPYLPERYLRNIAKLPEHIRKRYIFGSWDVFAGQIFYQFLDMPGPEGHLCAPFTIPKDAPRWRAIDHGYKHPAGCLWITRINECYYVYREYKQDGSTAAQNGANIHRLSGSEEYQYDIMDSSCFSKTGHDLTIAEEYQQGSQGKLVPIPSRKSDDLSMINRLAEWFTDRKTPDKGPRLRIFDTCAELRNEIVSWKWATVTSQILRQEKPRDANNDLIDPLIYFAIMQAHEAEPEQPKPEGRMAGTIGDKLKDGFDKLDQIANKTDTYKRRRF